MRIISGIFKGHKFHPPADKWPTRPTTDISKEGLFNMLQNQLDFAHIRMLDLFGGTGNHSFECISRGCEDVTYVDKHKPAVAFVKKQAREWNISDYLTIYLKDVKRFVLDHNSIPPFDYVFAGPPYPLPWLDEIPDLIFNSDILAKQGLFVMEHNPDHNFENHPHFVKSRNYGQTIFAFFE
jgi:16S rRNA (guanine(966)-N(2))-methyltransferase RsmD